MQKHRLISLASILAMLLIPVLGWFLVAQPQLEAASAADQQRADTEAQIAASTAIVAQLKADSAKLPELNDDLNVLRTSIPANVDSSGYIDGLDALARLAHVEITGLTVGDAQAYVPAAPAGQNSVASDAAASPDETAAPEPVQDPAVVTSGLIDSGNFVTVPVTVEVSGKWAQVLKFVQGLQSSPRLFLVTAIDTKVKQGSDLTATIGGFIYAIPTGVEGKPKPISTTVKHMDGPASAEDAGSEADGESPDTTQTPAPGATDEPAP